MSIVSLNQGWTDNLGDNAIDEVMLNTLHGYNVISLPFAPNQIICKNFFEKIYALWKLDSLNQKQFAQYISEMQDTPAAVVIGGGELLTSNLSFNSAFVSWTKVCKNKGIPVLVYGVSGNKLNKLYSIRIRKALKNCCFIAVRDKKTQEVFKTEYSVSCEVFPDVVFAHSENCKIEKTNRDIHKTSLLCNPLSLEYYMSATKRFISREAYFKMWEDLIRKNYQKNMKVLVGYTANEDKSTAVEFLQYIKVNVPEWNAELSNTETLNQYWDQLDCVECIISARMHSMILGILKDCRCVPVCFKEKIMEFNKEYTKYLNKSLPISQVVDNAKAGLEHLCAKLNNIIE